MQKDKAEDLVDGLIAKADNYREHSHSDSAYEAFINARRMLTNALIGDLSGDSEPSDGGGYLHECGNCGWSAKDYDADRTECTNAANKRNVRWEYEWCPAWAPKRDAE